MEKDFRGVFYKKDEIAHLLDRVEYGHSILLSAQYRTEVYAFNRASWDKIFSVRAIDGGIRVTLISTPNPSRNLPHCILETRKKIPHKKLLQELAVGATMRASKFWLVQFRRAAKELGIKIDVKSYTLHIDITRIS